MKKLLLFLGTLSLCAVFLHAAEVPLKMNFSGSFSTGSITFDFYITSQATTSSRLPGGTPWHEQYSTSSESGFIEYILGSQTDIPRTIFTGDSTKRYLEIRISGNSTFMEMVSVPFSYRSSYANELAGGGTINGNLSIKGNLGMGGNPNYKLDVYGTVRSTQSAYFATSSGSVGIGTTNPSAKLHVNSGDISITSGNYIIDSWGKGIGVFGSNYPNIVFNSDRLSLCSGSERLTILNSNGNVGIGTINPFYKLDVSGTGRFANALTTASDINASGNVSIQTYGKGIGIFDSASNLNITFLSTQMAINVNNSPVLTINSSGNVGINGTSASYKLYVNGNAYTTGSWGGSDIRLKNVIGNYSENILNKVVKLNAIKYTWNYDEYKRMRLLNMIDGVQDQVKINAITQEVQNEIMPDFISQESLGVSAQDLEKLFPELVKTDKFGYKAVAYEKISVVLLEAIKEQQKMIDELRVRLEVLEKR